MPQPQSRRRIIVHGGFHKTGTSSIQAVLNQNSPLIWPHYALVLPGRIPDVLKAATFQSRVGDPFSLSEYAFRLHSFLGTLVLGRKRGLCISAEDLCGLIPGRNGQDGYTAAPELMATTARVLEEVCGPEFDITFYLSLRQSEAWLRSTYFQNLRRSRLTMDMESYVDLLRPKVDLQHSAAEIAKAVAPHRPVATWLEDTSTLPLGPATPIVDLLGLPRATRKAMTATGPRNASPSTEIVDQMLAMNRSGLDDDLLMARKLALWNKQILEQRPPNLTA